jgi:hypothetical protein
LKTYLTLTLTFLSVIVFGCSSGPNEKSGTTNENGLENNCEVSGSVQTTSSNGTSTFTDVPSTSLGVDPSRQFFEEDLSSAYVDVSGLGWGWLVSGTLRWTGELTLDSVTGLESGEPHNARIFYELRTDDLSGSVFIPGDPQDSQGTSLATLTSEYRTGMTNLRTQYSLGPYPDYIQVSSQVALNWRYVAATNELLFEGIGSLDLGDLNQLGWIVNPMVSVCLGADTEPF